MGSVTMALNQICLALIFFLTVSCEVSKDGKKPAVVDWEKNNFGIRTSHSHEDGLDNAIIDRNAPQLPKRARPVQHEARKKVIKPTITRNKLRIRSKPKSKEEAREIEHTRIDEKQEEERSSGRYRTANSVTRRKSLRISTDTSDKRKDTTTNNRPEGFRSGRLRSRISPRIRATTETPLKAETIEHSLTTTFKVKPKFADFKESFMEKLPNSPKMSRLSVKKRVNTNATPTSSTFIKTATTGTISHKFRTTTKISSSSATSPSRTGSTKLEAGSGDSAMAVEDSITSDKITT